MPNHNTQKSSSLISFEELTNKLNRENDALVAELKRKYPSIYDYLVQKGVDFRNLQKYTKHLAAALIIAQQTAIPSPIPTPPPAPQPHQSVQTLQIQNQYLDPSQAETLQNSWARYGSTINSAAKKYNLDRRVIFATIMTESEGNPFAYRYEPHINDSSYGLGQILYSTAVNLGFSGIPEKLYDPETNIDLIARYHSRTLETYGNVTVEQMIRAYNAGDINGTTYPGHLDRFFMWYNALPNEQILASN